MGDANKVYRGDYIYLTGKLVIPAKAGIPSDSITLLVRKKTCHSRGSGNPESFYCLLIIKKHVSFWRKRGSDGRPSSLLEWDTSYSKFAGA